MGLLLSVGHDRRRIRLRAQSVVQPVVWASDLYQIVIMVDVALVVTILPPRYAARLQISSVLSLSNKHFTLLEFHSVWSSSMVGWLLALVRLLLHDELGLTAGDVVALFNVILDSWRDETGFVWVWIRGYAQVQVLIVRKLAWSHSLRKDRRLLWHVVVETRWQECWHWHVFRLILPQRLGLIRPVIGSVGVICSGLLFWCVLWLTLLLNSLRFHLIWHWLTHIGAQWSFKVKFLGPVRG